MLTHKQIEGLTSSGWSIGTEKDFLGHLVAKKYTREYWDMAEDACFAVTGKDWEWFHDCMYWMCLLENK